MHSPEMIKSRSLHLDFLKLETSRNSKSLHTSQSHDSSDTDLEKRDHFLAKAKSFLKKSFKSEKQDSIQKPRIVMRHRDSLDLVMKQADGSDHWVSTTWTIGVDKLDPGQKPGIIMRHRDSLDLAMRPPEDYHRRAARRSPAAA